MIILLASLVLLSASEDPEWSGFRGNNGLGLAPGASIPASLDPESNLAWKVEVPAGYSSPVVSGGHLFLTATEGKQLITLCLDRDTGEERWRRSVEFDGKRPGANSAAAPSPVTDGETVVVMFHSKGLYAYDFEGQELWRKEMGPFNIPHGLAASPVLHKGTVFQCVDQDSDSFLLALDVLTGDEQWRVARPRATHGYATPAIWESAEGDAQVIVSGSLEVAGYGVKDGARKWWAEIGSWQAKSVPVIHDDQVWVNSFMVGPGEAGLPNPSGTFEELLTLRDTNGDGFINREEWDHKGLQAAWFVFDLNDDDKLSTEDWDYLLAAANKNGGLYSVRLGGEGNVTETHVNWEYNKRRGMSDVASPLFMDDVLYMIKEGGILTALDGNTGEVFKQERVGDSDQYFASPVAAGSRIVLTGLSGQLSVIEAGEDWKVLSTTNIEERVWSTPALAGDQVFVRSMAALYCFSGEPAPSDSSEDE